MPPLVNFGGNMQIIAGPGEVVIAMVDPQNTFAVGRWTPDEARKFADIVEDSLAISLSGPDGVATIQLPADDGSSPSEPVAKAIRRAADEAADSI